MKPLPLPVRLAAGIVALAVEQARDLPRLVVEFPVTAVSQALQASMRVQQKVTEVAIKGDRALGSLRPVEEKPSWATFDEDEPRTNGSVTELRRGARPAAAPRTRPPGARVTETPAGPPTRPAGVRVTEPPAPGTVPKAPAAAAPAKDTDGAPARAVEQAPEKPAIEAGPTPSPSTAPPAIEPTPARTSTPVPVVREKPVPGTPKKPSTGGPAALPEYPGLTIPQLRAKLRTLKPADLRALLEWEQAHEARPPFVTMLSNRITTVTEA
ncbi:lipid droplet-associated protein [Pseudonocardia sp. KRD-184]|uniref:Lipid droplet-associated protein n=1 Tax=Pseudonocardia oceani TaxID=2792013 RepID=A0ABS6UCV2_9PSEU|nr:lipid droplet-associated protein [Pseudonocardia oceani]MBW0091762.1 lipid droplet-associated protein [Pseudonocardia oceani]MBW0098245.1 lipid droplet-associated protein [Pseudonocardia oceani]MBW0111637.1 lipid droplet-associated protein [Pseudonocardia oceani]MBW0124852.1 lipid droplet-associated protein [Pseudonocardia oceani]MBW0129689.1 lipid droplet-associated protein [Pseudonocardia oceani]